MSKICPNCGHQNRTVALYCGNCGTKLIPSISKTATNFTDSGNQNSSNSSTANNTNYSSTTNNANNDASFWECCCWALIILFIVSFIISVG